MLLYFIQYILKQRFFISTSRPIVCIWFYNINYSRLPWSEDENKQLLKLSLSLSLVIKKISLVKNVIYDCKQIFNSKTETSRSMINNSWGI